MIHTYSHSDSDGTIEAKARELYYSNRRRDKAWDAEDFGGRPYWRKIARGENIPIREPLSWQLAYVGLLSNRILAKIDLAPSGCWEWTGSVEGSGYADVKTSAKTRKVHRLIYALTFGEIPDGLQIDHLCRNRKCVNPHHLEAVTSRENTLRGIAPSAHHAVKTHCLRGHEFSPENTRLKGRKRICIECVQIRGARNHVNRKAKEQRETDVPSAPGGEGERPHLFLDCDGVLADFDAHALAYFGKPPRQAEAEMGSNEFWRQLEARGDFYRSMPVMADAHELVEAVRHLNPTILTGCPRGNWAEAQKVAWANEHFPGIPIITCRSSEKRSHAKSGDILIDDWPQHRHLWIEMGGHFIMHHDAKTSLAALWAHYPEPKP